MKLIRKILQWLAIEPFRGYRRGRLLRHYFLISVLLIAGGLIASGILEVYFRYQESREQLAFQQREAATVAALKIQTFIHDIETAMKAATKYQSTGGQEIAADYEFELKKLFYLAPAITEAAVVSVDGIARAHISRSRAVTTDAKRNFSGSAAFRKALQGQSYFGPVYFVRESEPYITVALPLERYAGKVVGVLQTEVNLKYVWEVISAIKQGRAGYAYARYARRRPYRAPRHEHGVATPKCGTAQSGESCIPAGFGRDSGRSCCLPITCQAIRFSAPTHSFLPWIGPLSLNSLWEKLMSRSMVLC